MKSPLPFAERLFAWDAPNTEIQTELLQHRHRATRLQVTFSNILVAGVVTAVMWGMKPHGLLLGWLAAITAVALLLAWSMADYGRHNARHPPRYWALRFLLGAFLNGVAWGSGALLLFDPAAPTGNILMVGVICGITAGAVVTSFAIPGSTYAFLLPAILLSMIMPLTQGSFAEHTLALLWIPYLAIMITLTRSAHRGLAQSIKLSHENERLAKKLAAAKEHAEQLARAKSNFLAVMSHEIRTPMHGMLGIAEVLSTTPLNKRQQLFLGHLRRAGEYLAQLLNNILDFSKIEAEKLELNEGVFSLAELVDEVIGLFELQAVQKGVVLTATLPDSLAPYWRGDAHRLKQVLINLLGNAMKFTERGGVTLAVGSTGSGDGRGRFCFRVIDTGPGIPPDRLAVIFDPFTQENASVSQEHGGTGLGLAISKRLVEAMGGELAVESRVDHGSTFSFELWLTEEGVTTPIGAAASLESAGAMPPARILLVDDSPFNRLVVKEFLRDTPCTLDEAENGLEAVQLFQRGSYEIVLMDMRMPGIGGIEAVRRIRAWETQQQRKPALIIMLTASVFESDRIAVMAAGCNELLTKPMQKATLLRLLRSSTESATAATVAQPAGDSR